MHEVFPEHVQAVVLGLKKLFCVYGVLPCSFCGSRSQQSQDLTDSPYA